MPLYIVTNRHEPEDCEPMDAGIRHLPVHLEGKEFYCTCPEGRHGFTMFLEGDSAEDVIRGLPPEWRRGTAAYPVEIFRLRRQERYFGIPPDVQRPWPRHPLSVDFRRRESWKRSAGRFRRATSRWPTLLSAAGSRLSRFTGTRTGAWVPAWA